jgi:hypothetical protein
MKTPIVVLCAVAVVSVAALFGWTKYTESQRFYIMNSGDGNAYRVDRQTGETWRIRGGVMSPVQEPEPTKSLEEVPSSIIESLEGSASYMMYEDTFLGRLYNPSGWHIKEVTVAIYDKSEDDGSRWFREFNDSVDLAPKDTGLFSIETAGGKAAGANKWTIKSAKGIRP